MSHKMVVGAILDTEMPLLVGPIPNSTYRVTLVNSQNSVVPRDSADLNMPHILQEAFLGQC